MPVWSICGVLPPALLALRRRASLAAILAGGLLLAGCGRDDPLSYNSTLSESSKIEKGIAEAKRDIAELAKGKDPDDLQGSVDYDQARDRLIARGAAIQATLWEALKTSTDWSIRMGIVEVLQAVRTKPSTEPLIAVLDDPQPLVAMRADHALQFMYDHREIPKAGEPTGANGLPPVPLRAEDDFDRDADLRIWSEWHRVNGKQLKEAWQNWWKANRDTAVVVEPNLKLVDPDKAPGKKPAKETRYGPIPSFDPARNR